LTWIASSWSHVGVQVLHQVGEAMVGQLLGAVRDVGVGVE